MTKIEKCIEERFEWPMIIAALLVLLMAVSSVIMVLPPEVVKLFVVLDVLIWILFYAELFVKCYVSSNLFATLKRNWILVLILLSPLLAPLRILKALRLIGLFRLIYLHRIVRHFKKSTQKIIYNIEYILGVLIVFAIIAALVMWQTEVTYGGTIDSFGDALWWSIVTVTTIGYGDVIPSSPAGIFVLVGFPNR